jgi:hypothetical protein
MRRAAVVVVVAYLAVALDTASRGVAQQPAAGSPVTIPFELAARHVIVTVSVNRSRPLSFVLDTGASAAIIRADVAKELGLSLQGSVNAGGAGPGKQAGSRVSSATWPLPGLTGFAQPVLLASAAAGAAVRPRSRCRRHYRWRVHQAVRARTRLRSPHNRAARPCYVHRSSPSRSIARLVVLRCGPTGLGSTPSVFMKCSRTPRLQTQASRRETSSRRSTAHQLKAWRSRRSTSGLKGRLRTS